MSQTTSQNNLSPTLQMANVPSYEDVLKAKELSSLEVIAEYKKLVKYKVDNTTRSFAGNNVLYHYQMDNLCRVKNTKGSFYDLMMNDVERNKMWVLANKYANGSRPNAPAMRLFEMYRRLKGAIVFFRPTIAINMYVECSATAVLDPCAGWGGRMLGAMVKNIKYTGIDTNTDLQPAYDEMMKLPSTSEVHMIWEDALQVDFSNIDYDCVLTSPPYFDLEIYPHMKSWETKKKFYTEFLMPLITKCRNHIRRNGKVCFNISPPMYRDLLMYGYDPCSFEMPMLQQKVQGKDKEDKVYIWIHT
jgi:hypothetical protein